MNPSSSGYGKLTIIFHHLVFQPLLLFLVFDFFGTLEEQIFQMIIVSELMPVILTSETSQ